MATKPVVQIDGKNFVAVPQGRSERVVRRLRNEDFISQFSGEGIRSPSTFLGYQTLIFPNFSLGLGRERIDSDSARVSGEYRRFWDATCDTRFASGVYLPILEEDSTSTGLEVIRASASFKANLWGIWEDGAGTQVLARKFVNTGGTTTTWTAGEQVLPSVTVDSVTAAEQANSTSWTFSHTVGTTYANRVLVLLVTLGHLGSITAIKYNGVDLTRHSHVEVTSGTHHHADIWYLVNPATGSNTVLLTGVNVNADWNVAAISFYNVDQSTPLGTAVTATGTSATPSIDVGSAADDIVVDVVAHLTTGGGSTGSAPGDGQTELFDSGAGVQFMGAGSRKRATSTTTTMSETLSGSVAWVHNGVAVKAASSGGEEIVGLDIIAHKNYLISLGVDGSSHLISRSTDGADWRQSSTQVTASLLANAVTVNEDIDAGLLAAIGGEAVAALWDEDSGAITFFSSADAGDVWVDESASTDIDISSGNGPQGLAVMAGIDNEDKLYVGTHEGLHEVDTATAVWTTRLIFPMVSNNDNCRRMKVMGDGALWFAQGVDDNTPPIVYRMFVSNGARVIERVPNDFSLGDGVTSDALGPIRWMESASGMVYVSAGGGAASRNARIWAHNGKGWHSMRKHGTARRKFQWIAASGDDDGVPRLHYALRSNDSGTAGAYTTSTHFLGQPFTNPASGVTIKRDTPGFVDLPYVDLSFPLDIKNWLRVGVNADTLTSGTTHQHINMDYGITSDLGALAARNAGDLGDILSGTRRLSLGTNGIGASGFVLGLRANMLLGSNPAANTVKPVLKDIQIDALPKPTKTRRFEVIVDIADTAALRGGANATAAIYTDLETIEDLKVKAAVTYADIGTKYMDVEAVHYDDEITGHSATGGPDSNARRGGTAQIILSEVAL